MHYYFTAVSLTAGICFGFGLLYLFIGLRRKDNKALNLLFAAFALCYAITLINGIRWYAADNVTQYVAITRFDTLFVAGALTSLIWYTAYYTSVRPYIFLGLLSAAFIVPRLIHVISPTTLYGEISGLTYIALPWGEKLTRLDRTGSIWLDIRSLADLVMLGYIIFALVRQFWRGERKSAIILGLGLIPFIAGIFYEALGQSGFVPYIPFAEFGFIGIALAASLQMANSVIKTEERLREYRHHLEELVETRTTSLAQTNDELQREIERRQRAEIVLRESEERFRKVFEDGPMGMALVTPDHRFLAVNETLCRMLDYSQEELTQLTIPEITFEADVERSISLAEQLTQGEIAYIKTQKQYVKKNGETLWANLTASIIPTELGTERYSLVMIEDITEQKEAEQILQQQVVELSVLHQTAQLTAHITDLPPTLQTVSEMLAHLLAARYIHIILPNPDEVELSLLVGFDRETGPIPVAPLDMTLYELPLVSEVLEQKESRVISDLLAHPLPDPVREFLSSHRVQSILLIPLLRFNQVVGLLAIASDEPGHTFEPNQITLAKTIGIDIASAIDSVALLEREKRIAAAEERSRIARELHDSVTQTLYSISIVAETMPRILERNIDDAKRNAGYLRRTTLGALAEMRALLFELRPESLVKASLPVLLQQLADILTGRTRIPVDLTISHQLKLAPEVKIALYRIAREVFNNIERHAKATQVEVTVQKMSDQTVLTIQDNGIGFNRRTVPPERLGLGIMRERAEEIGAVLTINSAPRQGTEITIAWSPATSNGQTVDLGQSQSTSEPIRVYDE